ncbi:translocation/assembly module TamB domain-containing protein [Novosphingobium sp. KCTC 2891]|uniref:translocation/assembly module TamB domain-containing protein n=1 Tax=Novosphingobium sp. KCTC 2891 TaxID=2989730 RepID=UPI00222136E3|nr:translocation/assembly module TamB domain-containing protein [Novosphingobium sp. KCTC 2891]MCW1381246.1 translocation/assembly module TamB domain-containing protein [Novosphingobium sp. KCTC 2891]
MGEDAPGPAAAPQPAAVPPRRPLWRSPLAWSRRLALLGIVVVGLFVAGLVVLDSSLGHRFVVDRIAALAPGSGLRIRIGRIEGSLFGTSKLRNVVLSDPQGRFMTIPEAELDWRPLSWMKRGLDIRKLLIHRATLLRTPRMNPGDPNQPILPNFDIRIDRLAFDNLTVAPGVMGRGALRERRRIDAWARVDIRKGRALIDVNGRLGGRDRLVVHLDSEPDRDKFELALTYDAPKNGLLAALSGVKKDVHARVGGRGGFSDWHGLAWASQDGAKLAAFLVDNRAGRYHVAGQAFPAAFLKGTTKAAVGDRLSLVYDGTLSNSVLDGQLFAKGGAFLLAGKGGLDLGNNRANDLGLKLALTRPERVMAQPQLSGVRIDAQLDGQFTDLAIEHEVRVARLRSGSIDAQGLRTAGTATWDGKRLRLPLAITAKRVVTGNAQVDPRFAGGSVKGELVLAGNSLSSEAIAIELKGLSARLTLRGDVARGGYALAGPVRAQGFTLTNLGAVDADAKILFKIGTGLPWSVQANAAGRMTRIDNATLANLTGGNIRFTGAVTVGQAIPLTVRGARISSRKLALAVDGRVSPDGRTTVIGKGRHLDYGPFTVDAAIGQDGPRAVLVFASPLPAAGLKDVRVALSPTRDGFDIETKGDSRLGEFAGTLGLVAPRGADTRIEVRTFHVYETDVTGAVVLGKAGITGDLALAGGGLNGTVHLAPRDGGQGVEALVNARNARFGGNKPISIGAAKIEVNGLFADGNSTVDASVAAQGIGTGKLFIGRLAANATLVNGSGSVTASMSGRRGTDFELQGTAAFEPDKVIAFVSGEYAGREISMPRRMVMEREAGGWRLQPVQLNFGRGAVIAQGHVLGGPTELNLQVSRMPLSVLDIAVADLGLGGLASGIIDYRNDGKGAPQGHAALQVRGLTRSGLVLTSRPLDVFLVADLDQTSFQSRAVMKEAGSVRGRLQARIDSLPRGGTIAERLRAGRLRGQVRYSGPADALWRLAAIEVFDLTGPLGVAADMTGTLDDPVLSGAVASRSLRVQSTLTGSDIRNVEVAGSFNDARLSLAKFSGTTPNGGRVTGSGTVDLSDVATGGVKLDLRVGATNAQLINRDDMGATVTGPLRIVSSGVGGTIAGRVRIEQARWRLGAASAVAELPDIATTERNTRADVAPARRIAAPWRFLIDAAGENRIDVRGMGLDSEWGANIRLRGDTAAPQIFGSADVVRGGYEFAGKRFELTRGRIRFAGEVPVDPRLDIVAEGDANGVSAKIAITGSSQKPIINFTSTPALPEEELLSRLLFGSSITQISAPEAVQLASALASLRGGGGLDPINKLRSAIGLDRLRIVGADASVGRGTAIAVGKYLGRRFFVELVTDGRGYSATSIEFRITRWLALLGTVSTVGSESVNLKASKDY